MKNVLLLILSFLLFALLSFGQERLVNRPMPLLPTKTLDGKTIDQQYFKGHITVVTFMSIGCIACMNEISTLNKLQDEYAAKGVQVLCIARQMRDQMIGFNGDDKKSYFYMVRHAMNIEPIRYAIQPACADKQSNAHEKIDSLGDVYVDLKMECNTLEEKYGITAIPVTFYLDKDGIIRKTKLGGPTKPNDPDYYREVKKEIDALLAQ